MTTSPYEEFFNLLCKEIEQITNKKCWYKLNQSTHAIVFIGGIPIKQPRFKTTTEEFQHFISRGYHYPSLVCNSLINAFELAIKSPSDYQYEKFIEKFKLPNEKNKTKN